MLDRAHIKDFCGLTAAARVYSLKRLSRLRFPHFQIVLHSFRGSCSPTEVDGTTGSRREARLDAESGALSRDLDASRRVDVWDRPLKQRHLLCFVSK